MKTIVRTETNESLYLFSDDEYLLCETDKITVGNPVQYKIADCNNTNTIVYTAVTAPDDWVGCKYLFDGTTWAVNPDYIQIT